MGNPIQELRERKARLMAEIDLIDQYLTLHGKLFSPGKSENISGGASTDTSPTGGGQKNDPKAVAKRAEEVLREEGRPLQRGDLVRKIEESGLKIVSKDKSKYLGTVLWRHRDTFVNIEDRGYWINGLDIEVNPAGYSFDD